MSPDAIPLEHVLVVLAGLAVYLAGAIGAGLWLRRLDKRRGRG